MVRCTLIVASIPNARARVHKRLALIIGEPHTCLWEPNAKTAWLLALTEKLKVRLTDTFAASKEGYWPQPLLKMAPERAGMGIWDNKVISTEISSQHHLISSYQPLPRVPFLWGLGRWTQFILGTTKYNPWDSSVKYEHA